MNGKLVVIEGLDGSGKATQTLLLKQRLINENADVRAVSFPCYESDSSALIRMYLGGVFGKKPNDVNAFAASAFYAVDRYASFKTDWGAEYKRGKLILADRYTTSNMVHQTAKLPRDEWDGFLDWLSSFEYDRLGLPRPNLVVFLATDPKLNEKLLSKRYAGDETKKDVHERDVEYLKAAQKAALYCAEYFDWSVVNCCANGVFRPIEDIARDIYRRVQPVLEKKTY